MDYADTKTCCILSVLALNFIAAAFHGVQAVVVFALISWLDKQPRSGMLFNGGHFDLVRVVPVWRENTIESVVTESGSIDVLYVILAFFVLSAVFQCAGGLLPFPAALRFIEYSFSASIMMLAIALEAGIRDLYTLQCMFVLIWATQIFGLVSDMLSYFAMRPLLERSDTEERDIKAYSIKGPSLCGNFKQRTRRQSYGEASFQVGQRQVFPRWELWLWLLPHTAGWATCLSAYAPAIDVFLQSSTRSERQPPSFVTALVFAELVMFSCFGIVQTYGLVSKTLRCIGWDGCAAPNQSRGAEAATIELVFNSGPGPDSSSYYYKNAPAILQEADDRPGGTTTTAGSSKWQNSRCIQQLLSLREQIDCINTNCEYAYIVLSLVAKTMLCWIILAPLLTDRINSSSSSSSSSIKT